MLKVIKFETSLFYNYRIEKIYNFSLHISFKLAKTTVLQPLHIQLFSLLFEIINSLKMIIRYLYEHTFVCIFIHHFTQY